MDTSTIAGLARDLHSPEQEQRLAGESFSAEFAARGWVPVVLLENVEEILRHGDVATVHDRFRSLARFPLVAHVDSLGCPGSIGSIVDILAREVRAFLRDRTSDAFAVVNAVRGEVFAYGDGTTVASRLRQNAEKARPLAQRSHTGEKFASSLSHLDIMGTDGVKFGSLRDDTPIDCAMVDRYCAALRSHLNAELRSRGVEGVPDETFDAFAERFAGDRKKGLLEAIGPGGSCTGLELRERLLQRQGIDPSQVNAGTTVRKLEIMACFNGRLDCASHTLGLPRPVTMRDVPMDRCPSQIIQNGVERWRRSARRAQAGDLFDAHLSTLACYCGLTVVDKRTGHYLRQLREHDSLAARLMGRVVSLSKYTDLLSQSL